MKKPAPQRPAVLPTGPVDQWVPTGDPLVAIAQPAKQEAAPASEQGAFSRGAETAFRQIPQTFGGALGLVGDATGANGLRDFGMGIYENQAKKIQAIRSDSDSFSNVLEGNGSLGEFVKYGTGYVGAQALSTIATGGIGALVGRKIVESGLKTAVSDQAKKQALARAAGIGATTAVGAQNLMQTSGSIYPEALEQAQKEGRQLDGGDFARIGASSVASAAVDTAMDMIGLNAVMKGAKGASLAGRAARQVPLGMAREGVTEGIQTGIERYGAGKELTGGDAVRDYVDSVALGALGGGLAGAASSIRSQKQPEIGPMTVAGNAGLEGKAQEADVMAQQMQAAAQNPTAARAAGIDTDAVRNLVGIDGTVAKQVAADIQAQDPLSPAALRGAPDASIAAPTLPPMGELDADAALAKMEKAATTDLKNQRTYGAQPLPESRLDGGQALGMQNRDRSRDASVQQMNNIANNPEYDRLGVGRTPNEAAPMVSVKGNAKTIPDEDMGKQSRVTMGDNSKIGIRYAVVEADDVLASHSVDGTEIPEYFGDAPEGTIRALNNGRIAGLREAYKRGTTDDYIAALLADAEVHGIDPEAIKDKKNPILVRVYDDKENSRPNIGAISNPKSNLGFSGSEAAMNDARMLDLSDFVPSETGKINTPENQAVLNRFATAIKAVGGDTADVIDTDGRFSKGFVNRFKGAVFAKAFKNQSLAEMVTEEDDPDLKNIINALQIAAPTFARIDDAQNLEIRPQIAQAVGKINDARARGFNLEQYSAQQDLLGQDSFTETLVEFLWANQRSPRRLGEALSALAGFIDEELQSRETIGLFGDSPQSLDDIAKRANKYYESQYGESLKQYLGETPTQEADDAQPGDNADDDSGGEQALSERGTVKESDGLLQSYTLTDLENKTAREAAARKEEARAASAKKPSANKRSQSVQFDLFEGQLELFDSLASTAEDSIDETVDDLVTRADATDEVKSMAKDAMRSIAQAIRRGSVLANIFANQLASGKAATIVGQKIHSAADLATISQVLRDPKLETFRYVFVKNGVVTTTVAVSSRLPSSSAAFAGRTASERAEFEKRIKQLGAESDQAYLLHNHPSGDPAPSGADIRLTKQVASELLPNFVAHVIVDTNKYSTIKADGATELIEKDFGEQPLVRNGVYAVVANAPTTVARLGFQFKKFGFYSLIATDSQLRVNGVMEVPKEAFANPNSPRLKALISRFAKQMGAGKGVFIAGIEGSVDPFNDLVRDGFLVDAVNVAGESAIMKGVGPSKAASSFGRDGTAGYFRQDDYSPKTVSLDSSVELLGLKNANYTSEVIIAETGKKATIKSKMGEEAQELDSRLLAARKLLECL